MTGGEFRDPGSFTVGSEVAGYRLEEQIGRGGMAVVYRARDVQLGRNVALKLLAPVLALDDAFRQRFIRESRAAAAVDHPYIIPIFAAGESGGVLFIAMRYVQGGDVRTLLDTAGPLPPARAAGIITQVALALDAAHLHGLVHRDIKPANMLLDSVSGSGQRDHVYLADFGLSKRSLSVTSLTSIGQFLGTPAYVSPEQVEGRPVDSRADQYALACASFEILSGAPPYERDDDLAVMWAHVSAPPPSLSARRPGLPAEIDEVLARAMAKSPADRFPTCLEFAQALRGALGLQAQPSDLAPLAGAAGQPPGAPGPAGAPGLPGLRGPAVHPPTEVSAPPGWRAAGGPPGMAGPAPPYEPAPGAYEPAPGAYEPAPGPYEPAPGPYEPAPGPYEPPTEEGWVPPLRPIGRAPSGPGGSASGAAFPGDAPPLRGARSSAGSGPPRRPDRGAPPPPRPDGAGRSRLRSLWWPRGAIVVGSAAVAGIAIGAVVGLHGNSQKAGLAGAASPRASQPAAALPILPVPGCSTAVPQAKTLTGVRSAQVQVGNQPFGSVTTADGTFTFVTLQNQLAVLSHGSSLAPTLDHVLPAPGVTGGEQLTNSGKYLLLPAGSGALVLDVANAEQGVSPIVGTLASPFGSGAVEVAVSPDDRFAFVTLESGAGLVVFDLQRALADGFTPSDVVGEVPLNQQPIGMAISPDHKWLYATSRMRTTTSQPSEGTLSVISLARAETTPSAAVVATAPAGCGPARVAASPDGRFVWVTSRKATCCWAFPPAPWSAIPPTRWSRRSAPAPRRSAWPWPRGAAASWSPTPTYITSRRAVAWR